MATLLTPAPDCSEQLDTAQDELDPDRVDRKLLRAAIAGAPFPDHIGAGDVEAHLLAREIRWVCEWWPPE